MCLLDSILTSTVANHVLENNVVTRSHEPRMRIYTHNHKVVIHVFSSVAAKNTFLYCLFAEGIT